MNAILKRLLPGTVGILAGVLASGAAATAADMFDAPYEQVPEMVPVEVGSGWYLRGDVSYDFKSDLGSDYRSHDEVLDTAFSPAASFSPPRYDYHDQDHDGFDLDEAADAGLGFGYQFTDYFRGDLTARYWKADIDGSSSNDCLGRAGSGAVFPVGSTCDSADHGQLQAWEVMANAYVDLGTVAGLTPYVGGGAGAVHIDYADLTRTSRCVVDGHDCGASFGSETSHDGVDSWRFAYALMAGASYDLSRELKIDLGYRYLNVDGGDMYDFDTASTGHGASGVQGTDDGFDRHTIQVGLRYALF